MKTYKLKAEQIEGATEDEKVIIETDDAPTIREITLGDIKREIEMIDMDLAHFNERKQALENKLSEAQTAVKAKK